ncbi:MAG: UDP-glucose dehydrogenase family protein [Actinomycetota bacterium]
MRACVVGTGHVGLATAVAFAHLGHEVTAIDSDPEKVAGLQRGTAPFFEPGLEELLREEAAAGRLAFTGDLEQAVSPAELVFLCVGTPARPDGEANLLAVERATRGIAAHATDGVVVVEKSTVPAGTAARVRLTLARERPDLQFDVACNPEFLREGRALEDTLHPDRVLVGADSDRAFEVLRRAYRPLTDAGVRLIETDITTAEVAKHACNAFLALKVSYANLLARLCEELGSDVVAVADVMGADPRIGRAFLNAGIGYGGYCLPKDVAAFERLAARAGYDVPLLREVARINDEALDRAFACIREALWNLEDKRIALLGLAYKPGTDDVRESPALKLARTLLDRGARVVGFDPHASANAKAELPDLEVAADADEAARGAHCMVVCTEWEEFRSLDPRRLKELMAYPVVVDGRNLLDPRAMEEAGFTYYAMGRSPGAPPKV